MADARIGDGDEQRPYFFLSYARSRFRPGDGTDPDRWVTKLFNDLCADVGVATGASNPGFMDRQIPVGTQWPNHLGEALANCRVFVALISPSYFASDYCGKEWAAFVQRIERYSVGGERPPAIIPALWTPLEPDELPLMVRSMQYIPPDFPTQYSAEGFYGIMKLGRYREAYKQTVLRLARLIKTTAVATNLDTCPTPDLASLESPFAGHHANEHARRPIRLTVAAHPLDKLPSDRDTYYYGRTVHEWAPYRSGQDTTPVSRYAERVIADLGHQPIIGTVDDLSEESGSPTVLLVDPWVTADPAVGDKLQQVDEDPVNVLVPFNRDDSETVSAESALSEGLHSVLGRSLALHGSEKRVPTIEAFRAALPKAVNEAIARYFKTAPAHPPKTPPMMNRPTLLRPEN
jgi:hypothetical protein